MTNAHMYEYFYGTVTMCIRIVLAVLVTQSQFSRIEMLKLYLIAYISIGLLFDGILVWSYETRNNSVTEQPDESKYCFINDSVVRKKLDGTYTAPYY